MSFNIGVWSRTAMGIMREHTCLTAVIAACGLAATFTTTALIHSSQKHGIKWNPWTNAKEPQDSVPWDKRTQKFVSVGNREQYKEDKPLRSLLSEIYGDGQYNKFNN